MDRVLLVSASKKSIQMLTKFLSEFERPEYIASSSSGGEARRMLLSADYSLVMINTPLPDEFGHELALLAARESTAGVVLLVKEEVAEQVGHKVEADGVFVLTKPLNRALVFQALHLLRAAHRRLAGMQTENRRLHKRIEDIRLVDRAKCLLIELRGMTEPEAHAYIEQEAMNRRVSKREIASDILQSDSPAP